MHGRYPLGTARVPEDEILPLRFDRVSYVLRGKSLIKELSFEIAPGRRTLILGPNGAGKSLTLRLGHGLIRPTSGKVAWLGPAAAKTGRRHAMVFQRPVLLRRSARANLEHALALGGASRAERRERALAALSRFGLADLAERPARVLSGGEQQRLALARAWVLRPQVVFLDEPCSALDPASTRAVEEVVETLHAEGAAIVMSTHDLGQARRLADEVIFLAKGQLKEQTPAETFFRSPRSEEAAAFLRGELVW